MLRHIIRRSKPQIEILCFPIYIRRTKFHSTGCLGNDNASKHPNPFKRTAWILKNDMIKLKNKFQSKRDNETYQMEDDLPEKAPPEFPTHCDVVIIGGGAIGSSIAYWLKKRGSVGISVVVVEKDPTYQKSSSVLSVGGIRQQYSLEENIEMSLYGAEFIRNMKKYLSIEGETPIDPQFHPYGYLFLASEQGAEILAENSKLQKSLGAKNVLLNPQKLKQNFPWINTDGIALGCYGLQNEGWFDPWALLSALKKKAIHLGCEYVAAEARGFEFKEHTGIMVAGHDRELVGLDKLMIETKSGEIRTIKFAIAIIAAGSNSSEIAKMAKVGTGPGMLSVPLPVEPRKRYVYCVHCPDGPGLNTPMTIDPTGTYFRREGLGGNYVCGKSPDIDDEPSTENLDVDHEWFTEKIWPVLANRVKAFENLKVKSAWAGYYDYNTFDENGIIGVHPYYHNLYFATGFSGHGIQQAPAVGRAITELIVDSNFQTIDLTRLGFDRLITLEPMKELGIV